MHLYATRLRHALLDLARRLQCNPDDEVMDFIIYRLQKILRHLVCILSSAFGGLDWPSLARQTTSFVNVFFGIYLEYGLFLFDLLPFAAVVLELERLVRCLGGRDSAAGR